MMMKKDGNGQNYGERAMKIEMESVEVDDLGRIEIKDKELAGMVGRLKSRRLRSTKDFPKPPQKPGPGPSQRPKPTPSDSMCACVAGCGCGGNTLCNCA
ncbi:MAG: hypothetical protein ACYDHZ_03310 [Dehalococcoidia bacterium]